jgi:hypothetical protein
LNRYGWWKRQDGATCHQDRLIRQQLIEQLTREILNYDCRVSARRRSGRDSISCTALGLAGDIEDRARPIQSDTARRVTRGYAGQAGGHSARASNMLIVERTRTNA